MLQGNLLLLNCQSCDKHVTQQTLASGNSFGAVEWTDGRMDMPMMPRKHDLPFWYCPKCRTFQRVSEMEIIEEASSPLIPMKENPAAGLWEKAYEMQEPGWRQYLDGIEQWKTQTEKDPDLETYIRMLSWHRYNDRYRYKLKRLNRKQHEQDIEVIPPDRWAIKKIKVPRVPEMIENCNNAANWLYEGNPKKALDKADLLRWLGRYELSLQLLGLVKDLDEFDKAVHLNRYSLLVELSREQDFSLCVVPAGTGV
jgi:hypothetical protein